MTSDNDMRDRIADLVEEESFKWDTDFRLHMDSPEYVLDPGPLATHIAQAIIDEFGLTVEAINPHRDKFTDAERERYGIRPETRVVGKWERNE